ncbi:MAG: class I SAM-dependent methyltransferase [Chloroflexota bacterium]
MSQTETVIANYTRGDLEAAIRAAIAKMGKSPETMTIAELAAVDEFHIGGRAATKHLLDQLVVHPQSDLLDVGCGLGGAARFVSSNYGCHVTGVDLTSEYIATGRVLNNWVGLAEQIQLKEASALALPFPDGTFDAGYMIHVGMNIGDKVALFREIYRVLRLGASFGVYDIMRIGAGELVFPVPWATVADSSQVVEPAVYGQALGEAGFEITAVNNRHAAAQTFFQAQQAKVTQAGGPPLGLHTLIGAAAPAKFRNMVASIQAGALAPVEIIVHKASSEK